MALTDFDKIMKEYQHLDNDFGFSAVSEEEYNKVINDTTTTADNYKHRLEELEKMIVPFLMKLYDSAEKEYIYWPNRKNILETTIEKVLKLTREEQYEHNNTK